MERITKQDSEKNYYIVEEKICLANEQINPIRNVIILNENRGYGKPIDKLGRLEDIEEKIGIDLETIFKALEDGIYCRVRVGNYKGDVFEWNIEIQHCLCKGISEEGLIVVDNADYYPDSDFTARYTEYKTGWALTEEELEEQV